MLKIFGKKENTQIEEIKKQVAEIKAMMNDANLTQEDYLKKGRVVLNMLIIQALIGAEFVPDKKGGYKIKFNKDLPTKNELAEIVEIVNNFIGDVENPYLESLAEEEPEATSNGEDMSIPEAPVAAKPRNNVPVVEKWNGKKLKNYIFGYDGKSAMSRAMLTSIDCIHIAAIGEEVRKRKNMNTMLIVGGVALLITGGVVAGYVIHNHNKKEDAELDDMIDEIDEIEVDEVEVEVTDSDDVPVVEVEVE